MLHLVMFTVRLEDIIFYQKKLDCIVYDIMILNSGSEVNMQQFYIIIMFYITMHTDYIQCIINWCSLPEHMHTHKLKFYNSYIWCNISQKSECKQTEILLHEE